MRNHSGIILAGGKSRRMGQDKAWLELQGIPLIVRVLERVRSLAEDVVIVANDFARYERLDARLVADEIPNGGPLAGMAAGLNAARYESVLVVACDMPFLNPELVRYLFSLAPDFDVVIPNWNTEAAPSQRLLTVSSTPDLPRAKDLALHPLHAVYRKPCLEPIRRALQRGDRRLVSFHADVRVRVVEPAEVAQFDPQGRSFWNLNTPEDLARFENAD